MKSKKLISLILLISLFANLSPVFAEDTSHTPEPYSENEFPQGMKDLRRFTIITFGAMPFVTIDTMLTYSTIRWAQHDFSSSYSPNIFDTSAYSSEEQMGLLLTSLGICIGIGITDYIIQVAKRNKQHKKSKMDNIDPQFRVLPIGNDPDAIKLDIPEEIESLKKSEQTKKTEENNQSQSNSETAKPEEAD